MLVEKITSRQNPLVKRFRRVRAGGDRAYVFLEGIRLIEEALEAGVRFDVIAFTSALEAHDRGLSLIDSLRSVPCRGANVSEQVMKSMADTETPQGVAAIVSRPFFRLADVFEPLTFIVIADGLQDPGNLGTLIRTSEAVGASAFITTRNTVDPFNQKALRASMGSAMRLPIAVAARSKEIVSSCKEHGIRVIATRPARPSAAGEETRLYVETDFSGRFALALGGEAEGLTAELAAAATEFVSIPMSPQVESLNVAAAGAIVLYEAARQRGFKF